MVAVRLLGFSVLGLGLDYNREFGHFSGQVYNGNAEYNNGRGSVPGRIIRY
jgi:hypothetical protein